MHISPLSKIYPQQSPVSFFGCCIRNYNDVLAIGARYGSPYDPVGPGFVDVYINGQYSQTLQGAAHGERFGVSIALNEQYLCIGAYRENTGAEPFMWEAYYGFKVNDSVTVTPTIFGASNANGTEGEDYTGAVIETQFKF